MQIYNGKSVFGGIAIGKISVYQKKEQQVKRVKIDDPEQEMARYEKAKAEGIKQLQGLYDKALREADWLTSDLRIPLTWADAWLLPRAIP